MIAIIHPSASAVWWAFYHPIHLPRSQKQTQRSGVCTIAYPGRGRYNGTAMTETARHPWPASWSPFWRGVLHILIATGVGNVAAGLGSLMWLPERMRTDPVNLFIVGCLAVVGISPVFPVLIVIKLSGPPLIVAKAVKRGFCVGMLVVMGLLAVGDTLFATIPPAKGDLLLRVGLLVGTGALCLTMCIYFLLKAGAEGRRRILGAAGIGIAVLFVAWIAAFASRSITLPIALGMVGSATEVFFSVVSTLNPTMLTLATVSKLLVVLGERGTSKGDALGQSLADSMRPQAEPGNEVAEDVTDDSLKDGT